MSEAALQISPGVREGQFALALRNTILMWARSTTGKLSHKTESLINDKRSAVAAFFRFVGKTTEQIDIGDVEMWRNRMEARGLKPNTLYARISRVASFFQWLMRDPKLGAHLKRNPARQAMPRRPKAYQTESTKAYTDGEMKELLAADHR